MLTMNARIEKFAIESFVAHVQSLLDDPTPLLHHYRDQEPSEAFTWMRALSADLGLDFDALCKRLGVDFDIYRLQDIENGIIKPATRELREPADDAASYPKKLYWSQEDEVYIAVATDLPGASAMGNTGEEALAQMPYVISAWLSACFKSGKPEPLPNTGNWEPEQEGLEEVAHETPAI